MMNTDKHILLKDFVAWVRIGTTRCYIFTGRMWDSE